MASAAWESTSYPKLIGVGAASADFYLRTGRMPLAYPSAQPAQKAPAFNNEQIRQLVAYVASLGDGPPVPDVNPDRGDLALGPGLFSRQLHGLSQLGHGGRCARATAPTRHRLRSRPDADR